MDSENLSSLIRLSVSDGQKTDSSKVVSVIGTLFIILIFTWSLDEGVHVTSKCIVVFQYVPDEKLSQ